MLSAETGRTARVAPPNKAEAPLDEAIIALVAPSAVAPDRQIEAVLPCPGLQRDQDAEACDPDLTQW